VAVSVAGFLLGTVAAFWRSARFDSPPFVTGRLVFPPCAPQIVVLGLGLVLWVIGMALWLRDEPRRHQGLPRRKRLEDVLVVAVMSVLMTPTVFTLSYLVYLAPDYRVLSPVSPAGCRAVLEDNGWGKGSLYYAETFAGRGVDSGIGWSSAPYSDPRPIEHRTWSLTWDGETAVLEVWGPEEDRVETRGEARPCRAPDP
jgi:hypothetical protein